MTSSLEVVIVGLILSADSFSAALTMGARPHRLANTLQFALSSASAEVFLALLGAILGASIVDDFHAIDHWVSFILLSLVAIHMIYEGFKEIKNSEKQKSTRKEFHGFFKILVVSFATSLDAFIVGVSLELSAKPLAPFIISIGFWTFTSTILGMKIAKQASQKLGPVFNFIGAIILLILAIKFLMLG